MDSTKEAAVGAGLEVASWKHHYDATSHGSDAPIVAATWHQGGVYGETHNHQQRGAPLAWKEQPATPETLVASPRSSKGRRICGMGAAVFALAVALAVVIVGAAVGGGVGASMAAGTAKSLEECQKATAAGGLLASAATTSSTGTSASSATSLTTSLATSLATGSSSTCGPTISTASNGGIVVPTGSVTVGLDCPNIESQGVQEIKVTDSRSWKFRVKCGVDPRWNDFAQVVAYSLRDCMVACASFNYWSGTQNCTAVSFDARMEEPKSTLQGNCWMKNKPTDENTDRGNLRAAAYVVT